MTEREVMITTGDYFLSKENAAATAEQRDIEEVALRLIERPELRRARAIVDSLFRSVFEHPARQQMSTFDNFIDEYIFHFAMRAANSDARHPKIHRFMLPQHSWLGHDLPGSRWGGESSDFIYRVIPIAHGGQYEIRGRATCKEPPTVNYSLIGDTPNPVVQEIREERDLPVDADGEFVLTIDATPSEGRTNHIQTKPDTDHLFIRDALGDWLHQRPNALRVRRLNPPDRAPLSEDAMARQAARRAMEGVYYQYFMSQYGRPPNTLGAPMSSALFGGMPTQYGARALLEIEEDEAFVVTATRAGANFRNVQLWNAFFITVDYWSRMGSLNMTQMAPDEDGRFTYVVSHEDPGVHNWLDTNGWRRLSFGQRWQSFETRTQGAPVEIPRIEGRLVKLKDLDLALPGGVRRIGATERKAQLAARLAGFNTRFIDS
jgi:hypothetical protein